LGAVLLSFTFNSSPMIFLGVGRNNVLG